MSPLKAIHKFCVHCVGEKPHDVKQCGSTEKDCNLYPLRFGKKPENGKYKILKEIRKKCTWCMGGNVRDIANCLTPNCHLFQFRFGKNPALKGKRGSNIGPSPRKSLKN